MSAHPLVQKLGHGHGPFTTAALLYAGAVLVGALLRQQAKKEARVLRMDVPRLLAVALFGAVIGPVALAWGLQRTSATGASLMLTLEALFTALLAWRLYGETMDRRVWAAMLLLLAGGVLLILVQDLASSGQWIGLLAVLAATAAWGTDNTLSRALAERDPDQVVQAKSALGAAATAALALIAGAAMPMCQTRITGTTIEAFGGQASCRALTLATSFGIASGGNGDTPLTNGRSWGLAVAQLANRPMTVAADSGHRDGTSG